MPKAPRLPQSGSIAWLGSRVIESVYLQRLDERPIGSPPATGHVPEGEPTATIRSSSNGVVLAFDQKGLLALAQRADSVIEMVPQVGDQVAAGDPLFRVFKESAALLQTSLCESIALGQERTLEQDPTFVFRILVDVALKGLSPAINDPTTAVLALDRIHHLLRIVGNRQLNTGQMRDKTGRLRFVYRTPDWEDFVHLAVTEIRHCGCTSIQIARRLRAMLEDLIQSVPEARAVLLRQELALLRRSAERAFAEPEDRALAEEAARLRREFGVSTGWQRGPFFEVQSERFALIAVDTGVLRRVDTTLSMAAAALT
jgi:uncharacterized membrane protein